MIYISKRLYYVLQEGDNLVRQLLYQLLLKPEDTNMTGDTTTTTNIRIQNESQLDEAIKEVASYLKVSFGDRTRIDYGSGHELSFLCFLFCLHRLNYLRPCDFRDAVLIGFTR